MNIPNIKNAYENIKNTCERRLTELYPAGIPEEAKKRLDSELKYLKTSNYINDFEITRLLYSEANRSSQYMICRGTTTGSFIFYLISNSRVNPLTPHYYCPKCGSFKTITGKLFGIDLPQRKCEKCDEIMISDGYKLSIESVWGLDGKKTIGFEFNISKGFYPFAKRLLERTYPDNNIVPYGVLSIINGRPARDLKLSGYLILSKGQTIDDYPDLQGYLENGDLCLTGNVMDMEENNIKRILLYNHNALTAIVEMQQRTGIYISDINNSDLSSITWSRLANTRLLDEDYEELIRFTKPETKTEMINLLSVLHSTFTSTDMSSSTTRVDSIIKKINQTEFKSAPCYSRDDIFELLLKFGVDHNTAYEYSEYIRKGLASRTDTDPKYDALKLPDEFRNLVKTIKFSWPRSHSVEYLLMYAMLAFYLKADSKEYSKMLRSL